MSQNGNTKLIPRCQEIDPGNEHFQCEFRAGHDGNLHLSGMYAWHTPSAEPNPQPPVAPEPRWVKQEDSHGCVVAALAMIVGKSYGEVKSELQAKDLSSEAYTAFTAESYLYEHGYRLVKRWKHVCYNGTDRQEWPISPFAPIHYVSVQNGTDMGRCRAKKTNRLRSSKRNYRRLRGPRGRGEAERSAGHHGTE